MLTYKLLSEDNINTYLPDLARLRMTVFRDYPYLYVGDIEYEKGYLRTYTKACNSIVILVMDDDRVVGAATGIPLCEETDEVKRPFVQAGYDVEQVFYFGESVLLPEYRGNGVGVSFFEKREAHAKSLPGIKYCSFCAVQRPDNHPSRPCDYKPLNDFWCHRGYEYHSDLTTQFEWQEIGEQQASPKTMAFWLKKLP
ncbi:MAG: GNAT family N-acetyltransferase [Alteromonadaceae bacterium]|nr:GNAT family N-acetyltransferase [Alteromonadaceae bacterium]